MRWDGTGWEFSSIAFGVCIGGVHGKGTKFMHLWCLFDCGGYLFFLLEGIFFLFFLVFFFPFWYFGVASIGLLVYACGYFTLGLGGGGWRHVTYV